MKSANSRGGLWSGLFVSIPMIKEPSDFLGNIFSKLLNTQLSNPTLQKKMFDWRMAVVIYTDYYPLTISFGDKIDVTTELPKFPTITLTTTFNTIIKIAQNKKSMIKAIMDGSIKTKGLLRHPRSMFRFYRLMSSLIGG